MIKIVKYESRYLEQAIRLIGRSDSTDRTYSSWEGCQMTGTLAFNKKKPIGILPSEQRSFKVGPGRLLRALWISGAHVEPEFRSKGVGAALSKKMRDFFSHRHDAVFAFRQDETSAAYKWYRSNGFYDLASILSFKKKVTKVKSSKRGVLLATANDIAKSQNDMYRCFSRNTKFFGGHETRNNNFWARRTVDHYYKNVYQYAVAAFVRNKEMLAYALLGITAMKDGISRFDILEFVTPEDDHIIEVLLSDITAIASENSLEEIRVQLSSSDARLPKIRKLGFVNRWRTNILGYLLDPLQYMEKVIAEVTKQPLPFQMIIETPLLGVKKIGKGKEALKLFMGDEQLHRLLLGRLCLKTSLSEDRIVMADGNKKHISFLEKIFPLTPWQYFQMDYA